MSQTNPIYEEFADARLPRPDIWDYLKPLPKPSQAQLAYINCHNTIMRKHHRRFLAECLWEARARGIRLSQYLWDFRYQLEEDLEREIEVKHFRAYFKEWWGRKGLRWI